MAINFTKWNFKQFLNRNVKILGKRLYSPSLEDVSWLEDAQLIFLIFHTSVLAYDLLEDRCSIDVIIAKIFPLCFKMAESVENLYNILHDWAKDKYKKKYCRGIEQV